MALRKAPIWRPSSYRNICHCVLNVTNLELRYIEINISARTTSDNCSVSKNISDKSSFDPRDSPLRPPVQSNAM